MELITIAGYVGKDAEIKESNGRRYTKFNIAVDKSFKTQNGNKVNKTNWWTVFSKNENIAFHIKKGGYLTVIGEPSFNIWTNDRRETTINLSMNLVQFSFGPNPNHQNQDNNQNYPAPTSMANRSMVPLTTLTTAQIDNENDVGDDLPF